MNWADWAIIVILGLSAFLSFWRGFVREALSLLGWLLAFWVAISFNDALATLLVSHITTPSVRLGTAFLILFVGTLIVVGIVNFLLVKLMHLTGLTSTDRMLGIVFGMLRGVAIVIVIVFLASVTAIPEDPWWRESLLLPHFEQLAIRISDYLPEQVTRHFRFNRVQPNPISG